MVALARTETHATAWKEQQDIAARECKNYRQLLFRIVGYEMTQLILGRLKVLKVLNNLPSIVTNFFVAQVFLQKYATCFCFLKFESQSGCGQIFSLMRKTFFARCYQCTALL